MAALALALPAAVAFAPFAAQAAPNPDAWNSTPGSSDWGTATNWSNSFVPGLGTNTNAAVTINSGTTINPVINTNYSLNTTTGTGGSAAVGSLTIGSGVSLTINSGGTLTMGATTHTITLNGASITGAGKVSGGTIQGFGTFSAAQDTIASTTWSANSASGALTLTGGNTYHGSFNTSSGQGGFNLNGVTLNGASLGGSGGGQFYVTGDSTLSGAISFANVDTINIGGASGPHTLNLSAATLNWSSGSAPSFLIGTGGTLNILNGASSTNNGQAITLNGGSITNSGAGGTFAVGTPISGTGLISGPIAINNGLTAGVGLLTVDGTVGVITAANTSWRTSGSGSVLDLKGTIQFNESYLYPSIIATSLGTIQLDSATLNTLSGQIQVSLGQVNVASGVNTLNGAFVPSTGFLPGTTASYTVANGATLSLQNPTTSTTNNAISGTNFTMAQGSKLVVGASHNGITLSGNFSFQQTDTTGSWTNGAMAGLGPDLTMTGGTKALPTTLEVGGINLGPTAGFTNNFALSSLTIGTNAYVSLMDQYANATASGWTSGTEALYLNSLFGTATAAAEGTLNLGGLSVYLPSGQLLTDGSQSFTNNGNTTYVYIDGAPVPVPEVSTTTMMLVGFSSLLGLAAVRRRKSSEMARATASSSSCC